jgi:hypothetical protein
MSISEAEDGVHYTLYDITNPPIYAELPHNMNAAVQYNFIAAFWIFRDVRKERKAYCYDVG